MMAELLGYVANSLAWSTVAFLGGFFVGRMTRDVQIIREKVSDMEYLSAGNQERRKHQTKRHPGRRRSDRPFGLRWTADRVMAALFIGLALITVVQGLATQTQLRAGTERDRRDVECQTQYNLAVSEALASHQKAARADRNAAEQQRTAMIRLISAILDEQGTPQDRREAMSAFLREQEEAQKTQGAADETRAENPIPSAKMIDKCLERKD